MRTVHATGFAAVLAATALVAPGAASAASPTTVTGDFAGRIAYDHCTAGTPAHPGVAGGDWSVTMNGSTAKATFNILIDGAAHVAYTFPGMKQAPNSTPTTFVFSGRTGAGLLTVTVDSSGMAYRIAPYSYGGLVCDSVTFPGTVD